jgi:hypothetical protein
LIFFRFEHFGCPTFYKLYRFEHYLNLNWNKKKERNGNNTFTGPHLSGLERRALSGATFRSRWRQRIGAPRPLCCLRMAAASPGRSTPYPSTSFSSRWRFFSSFLLYIFYFFGFLCVIAYSCAIAYMIYRLHVDVQSHTYV